METIQNKELQLASEFIRFTNKNVFLTGKAGTGKTTFLQQLRADSPKRMIVVAPTGVAAINAKGVTIHSFFQLPFGPNLPSHLSGEHSRQMAFNKDKINIIRSLDLLVIDEISMVRADLLDGIDEVLRRYKDRGKPFGGVQLLLIGDLHQLAPVVKDDEWEILRPHYQTAFFFSSHALQKTDYVSVELKHIYRQKDALFISLLNKVRENKFDDETLAELNKRYVPDIEHQSKEGFIILSTHNHQAQKINSQKMTQLATPEKVFEAEINGDFPAYAFPTEQSLVLKEGAQVMFVKNDNREKLYFNGKIGTVVGFEDNAVQIKCKDDFFVINAQVQQWENVKYEIDPVTKEIKETIVGSFSQIPIKLAWCITIHKSQGLTFDNAIIDAQSAFAFGQVYVALSRCKTLEGMYLSSPISRNSIKSNSNINAFTENIEQNLPTEQQLKTAIVSYQQTLLLELFSFPHLKYRLDSLTAQFFEHKSSFAGNLYEEYTNIKTEVVQEIIEVASKFQTQIRNLSSLNPNLEENADLQERVKKASGYFSGKIQMLLLEPLSKTAVESDNKIVKKAVEDILDLLYSEMKVKHGSLLACENGFFVKPFLEVRAVALLQTHTRRKNQPTTQSKEGNAANLLKLLKDWRNTVAIEHAVEPYLILQQKVMTEIVNELPRSLKALAKINGIGSKKIKSFGEDIINIVTEYCIDNQIDDTVDAVIQEVEVPLPKKKIDSKIQSLLLFQEGKTVQEIALARGFVVSTIEEHLGSFIGTGEIKIEELMPEKQINHITDYFLKASDLSLTTAKIALEDAYSYSQLRFVKRHLEATGQIAGTTTSA